jgi:hypothetical protein
MKLIRHYQNSPTQRYSPRARLPFSLAPGPNTFLLQQSKQALRSSQHIKMKYSTVEDFMASFPHPILPTVEGEPDYPTIHTTIKFLQANSRAIDTHLGGGTLGHLGLIISDASYAMIDPQTSEEPTLWVTPYAPGRAPATTDGTSAQVSAARHIWEEDVQTYRTYTSVQQALKKQLIIVFEPMYLEILNYNMVGYVNISAI